MNIKEFYAAIGGDYEDVCLRLPSDEFILRFVKRFLTDNTFLELSDAIKNENVVESFESAHKLKGIAGNLGFRELYQRVSVLSEHLKAKNDAIDECIVKNVTESYQKVKKHIHMLEEV